MPPFFTMTTTIYNPNTKCPLLSLHLCKNHHTVSYLCIPISYNFIICWGNSRQYWKSTNFQHWKIYHQGQQQHLAKFSFHGHLNSHKCFWIILHHHLTVFSCCHCSLHIHLHQRFLFCCNVGWLMVGAGLSSNSWR